MNKVLKVSVLAALLFGTLVSAADDSKMSLISGKNKSVIFTIDTQYQETGIKMLTEDGALVFAEEVEGESVYSKRFNLKNLKKGNYLFVIENSLKEVVYNISVTENTAKIVEQKENVKPVFRKKNGVVYMNLLNLDRKDVKINVYDSNERLLFQEIIGNEIVVEKSFNFVNAFDDSYTVVIQDGDKTYYEVVVVE
jgi:hypothetical protein